MTVTAKVIGMEALEDKWKRRLGALTDAFKKANQKSANEFEALVRQAVPEATEPEDHGPLVDTLGQTPLPTGAAVHIGDEGSHRYPMHLEQGHRARGGGSHVAGKPFWYPARRVLKKRSGNRAARAYRAVAKAYVAQPPTGAEG